MWMQTKKIVSFVSILFILLLCFGTYSYASTPVIFFSDLTDGPTSGWEESGTKGAAVSVWGVNFGTSGTLTCGGQTLSSSNSDQIVEWAATTNPTTARGLQRITFYLNSSMSTSGAYPNTTISVTVGGVTSATIPFHCRAIGSNFIYYVSTTGNNISSGKSVAAAWASLAKVKTTAVAGDVVYAKGGIYTAEDSMSAFINQSGGTNNNGSEGLSISISGYPGELAQFGDGTNDSGKATRFVRCYTGSWHYWTYSKLKILVHETALYMDANISTNHTTSHIRFVGNDVHTTYASSGYGIAFAPEANAGGLTYFYLYGNYIHHTGKTNESDPHGYRVGPMYFPGHGISDYVYVAWNDLYKNNGQSQFFGHTASDRLYHLYFHDNWIYDSGFKGLATGGDGADYYGFIGEAWIYNNIFAGCEREALTLGIDTVGGRGGTFYIYNNVFYDNSQSLGEYEVWSNNYQTALYFKNNIFYTNAAAYFGYVGGSTGHSGDHNLWYGAGDGPTWSTTGDLDNTDPKFISATPTLYSDFAPQSSSPVIGLGAVLTYGAPDDTKDFIGFTRGTAWDMGALEYDSGTTPPSATGCTIQGGTFK